MKQVGQISGGRSAGLVGRLTAGVRDGARLVAALGALTVAAGATDPPSAGRPTASK